MTETIAEMVAAQLDGDGQRFTARDGQSLESLCRAAGAQLQYPRDDESVWVFPDSSAIAAVGGGWDIRPSDCSAHCWVGGGCTCGASDA